METKDNTATRLCVQSSRGGHILRHIYLFSHPDTTYPETHLSFLHPDTRCDDALHKLSYPEPVCTDYALQALHVTPRALGQSPTTVPLACVHRHNFGHLQELDIIESPLIFSDTRSRIRNCITIDVAITIED